jgi:hypothetical protein
MIVVVVPAARETTNVDSAITEHAHILQAVPLGIMAVYIRIEVETVEVEILYGNRCRVY